jgi:hypothetical protein
MMEDACFSGYQLPATPADSRRKVAKESGTLSEYQDPKYKPPSENSSRTGGFRDKMMHLRGEIWLLLVIGNP